MKPIEKDDAFRMTALLQKALPILEFLPMPDDKSGTKDPNAVEFTVLCRCTMAVSDHRAEKNPAPVAVGSRNKKKIEHVHYTTNRKGSQA